MDAVANAAGRLQEGNEAGRGWVRVGAWSVLIWESMTKNPPSRCTGYRKCGEAAAFWASERYSTNSTTLET